MTNFERLIRDRKTYLQNLINYNESDGMLYTTDGGAFETFEEAIKHEIEWLDSEC